MANKKEEPKKAERKGVSKETKVLIGAGIAALAAGAAAAWFYGTEKGTKERKAIKGWMVKMKAEVMDKLGDMKDWSEGAYENVVDAVVEKYKALKEIDAEEVKAAAGELKKQWKTIEKSVKHIVK